LPYDHFTSLSLSHSYSPNYQQFYHYHNYHSTPMTIFYHYYLYHFLPLPLVPFFTLATTFYHYHLYPFLLLLPFLPLLPFSTTTTNTTFCHSLGNLREKSSSALEGGLLSQWLSRPQQLKKERDQSTKAYVHMDNGIHIFEHSKTNF